MTIDKMHTLSLDDVETANAALDAMEEAAYLARKKFNR